MAYFDTLKTLRESAGIKISVLAKEAEIDRSTIVRIEKHKNSTPTTLHSIVNSLNNIYSKKGRESISYELVITEDSKFGGSWLWTLLNI